MARHLRNTVQGRPSHGGSTGRPLVGSDSSLELGLQGRSGVFEIRVGQDGGVTARSRDAQAEHIAEAPNVAPAGVQFVEYPVFAGFLGGHAHRCRDPLDADRRGIERRSSADENMRVSGQGPTSFPVRQPSRQALPDWLGERDDAFTYVDATVADIGQLQPP
jgi:hypothetical protein